MKVNNQIKSLGMWLIVSSLIGIGMGALSAFFLKSLEVVTAIRVTNPWLLLGLPLIGMVTVYCYERFGGQSKRGNNLVIERANGGMEKIPLQLIPLTLFGTIATHLFGGSVGREGTAVQMGGALAEKISSVFKLGPLDKEMAIICGISGGFSSVFGTPLAGCLFALEVLCIGRLRTTALIPSVLTAFVAYGTTVLLKVSHTDYSIASIPQFTISVLGKVLICGLAFGLVSRLFSTSIRWIKARYAKWISNPVLRIGFGAIVVLMLVLAVGTTRYNGLSLPLLEDAFSGKHETWDFLNKLILTVFSLGAGFQGGEVTPLFEIGATLGASLGQVMNLSVSFVAALGFIGVFAGATNTPIACFVMGIELFGSGIAAWLLPVCIVSYLVSGHSGIYSSQQHVTHKLRRIRKYGF
ncbi:voltage-gated chloride channel protein [Vagococcus fessus]|uniref:Voltage-gated chloride channel protein n=2 Tax=Vagococcus fessus TaxID=120370 RepID=A0A430ACN8_9ENTE|nr:voltage-gated chloride channel family protein [Vagococcus fessus]RSU04981.1 voltage-gated chloride channel protein [Vagococcus fessus]